MPNMTKEDLLIIRDALDDADEQLGFDVDIHADEDCATAKLQVEKALDIVNKELEKDTSEEMVEVGITDGSDFYVEELCDDDNNEKSCDDDDVDEFDCVTKIPKSLFIKFGECESEMEYLEDSIREFMYK